jgi:uncharacterized protein (TIGR04255 family)
VSRHTPARHQNALFTFDNPPVTEVVFGIQFNPLIRFTVSHYGQLWEDFKVDGYELCQDTSPLFPAIERFDSRGEAQPPMLPDPLLPRVWFVHIDGTGIVQVQRDRFLHNWKKAAPKDDYPRYHLLKQMFTARYGKFSQFIAGRDLGPINPIQYEITYVNHIQRGEGWNALEDVGSIFPDFRWRADDKRFLPSPSGNNLRLTFDLPDRTARLHFTVRDGIRTHDQAHLMICELTVRGMPPSDSQEAMETWFDTAREWIVRGFVDLTEERVQRDIWGRAR